MIKKVLIGLGILVVLFAGVNTVAALNPSILDAISGLPLSDQILYIAKEVDRLKLKDELRDACDEADKLFTTQEGIEGMKETVRWYTEERDDVLSRGDESNATTFEEGRVKSQTKLDELVAKYDQYGPAKADCDRLTEEFNQKYGE